MKLKNIKRAIIEGTLFEKSYIKGKYFILGFFNGRYRKKIFKILDTCIADIARYHIAQKTEVKNNKILFITSRGSYNCNPKAIAEEIIRQKLPWDLVWVARKENMKQLNQYPKQLKVVLRGSQEFYQEVAEAKVWIDNSVNLSYLNTWKKKEQVLFETWHGSLGIKRFETNNDKIWIRKAKKCGKRTDYCISNSDFEDDLYRNSFWENTEILKCGHARNDILFATEAEKKVLKNKVCEIFGIDSTAKIALYAPTFRDEKTLEPYSIDYLRLKNILEEKFGGDWCILSRLHFEVRKLAQKMHLDTPDYVYDVTSYEDIQDLLVISDVGITDYSSWICDFMLMRKPAFLFATDLKDYYSERGFYYPLETTPFPIAENNSELMDNILNFEIEEYKKSVNHFLDEKGCIDDGLASRRVVEKLKEILS